MSQHYDFTVIPSDDPDVREADRGFLTEVSWTVTAPEGGKSHGVRRVLITADMGATVHLGLLAQPEPVAPYTGGYALAPDLAAEVATRAAADTALDGRVDALEVAPPAHTHPLADVADAGTAAAADVGDFATAAQGALADSATQPGDLATVATTGAYADLTGKPTLGTAAATAATDYATAAQGAKADAALTPAAASAAYVTRDRRVEVEQQVLSIGKGGVIGTSGRMPVAFRIDDGQDQLLANSIVQKFSARAWPVSLALCTTFKSQSWNQVVAWTDIRTWTEQHGAEVWSHGTTHISPNNVESAIYDQIVNTKATIEANGLRCMGWAMPGVPDPGFGTTLNTFDSYWTTFAGRLVRETYALAESDASPGFRRTPSALRVGLGHFTISDGTGMLALAQAALDSAITAQRGIEFMFHPDQLGLPGRLTLAELDTFIAYVATKEAAGEIVVVAPSSMPFCDPSRTDTVNLIANGRFTGTIPNVTSGERLWRHVNGTTISNPGGQTLHDGTTGNALQINGADGLITTQQLASVKTEGLAGQPLKFSGWARAVGTLCRARFRVETNAGDGPYVFLVDKNLIALTTSWTKFEFVFTPPPWSSALNFSLGKGFGGGGGTTMQWDDVSVRPA